MSASAAVKQIIQRTGHLKQVARLIWRKLTKDKTAVLISHRLSTVRMVDTVYVLENGKIFEQGRHD